MSEEVGRMGRPRVESFTAARKLYLVPLVLLLEGAPPAYADKFDEYWRAVGNHLRGLELKLGKINKVYHESIYVGGEEGLKVIEKLNEKSYSLVKSKCDDGAEFIAVEDGDLFAEAMDWGRCLAVVLSQRVVSKVSEFYREASRRRYDHISKRIDETLREGDVGMLIIGENHSVQFPSDVDVFYVSPSELDELHRILRDHFARPSEGQAKSEKKE
ncbi:MAG: hypothetical protein ACUVXI_01610 [bacterium]